MLQTHDWEEEDDGSIKITDISGVHFEIKQDPSCSTQIKHGRRLEFTYEVHSLSLGVTITGCNLQGTVGSDVINGGPGADTLNGGPGSDEIYGGPGSDILNGGVGADDLDGGDGNDILNGGDGEDTANYWGALVQEVTFYTVYDNGVIFTLVKDNSSNEVDVLKNIEKPKK